MTIIDDILNYLKQIKLYLPVFIILYLILAIITLLKPKGFPIEELTTTYGQFGSSLTAFILLLMIGGFLIYRYFTKAPPLKSKPDYLLYWGIAFAIFSLVFLGLCLEALGFTFADTTDPLFFLLWYSPLLLWLAGFWIGLGMFKRFEPTLVYIPALVILIVGEVWLVFGLFLLEDFTFTMYGFLLLIVIPMILIYTYYWFDFAENSDLSSPYIITIGFVLLAVTFFAWAFWYFTDVLYIHYIWTNILNISLTLIFAGYLVLPKETLTKF